MSGWFAEARLGLFVHFGLYSGAARHEWVQTYERLTDDEYRVRAQGPAPATNPFILVNPQGTDFRRSDDDFDLGALRMTASYRF